MPHEDGSMCVFFTTTSSITVKIINKTGKPLVVNRALRLIKGGGGVLLGIYMSSLMYVRVLLLVYS